MGARELELRQRRALAWTTLVILLLDNVTTILAVQAGARELNPLVAPFLASPWLWALFTIIKALAGYWIALRYVKDAGSVIAWAFVMYFFLRAAIINTLNFLQPT